MPPQPKKRDYQKELDGIIQQLKEQTGQGKKKPSLLLHACCAPCSSYVIEYLSSIFDITIYYYNPNIHPQTEYERRLAELKKFLTLFPLAVQNSVHLVVADYDPKDYFTATNVAKEPELQTEAEKGERCRRCYEFRMHRAYTYACLQGFDWFTTTLSISPHKDADKINTIGETLQAVQHLQKLPDTAKETRYLPANFKKRGGFLRSTKLSAEYGLWRQDYCGCVYSKQNNAPADI